MSLEPKEITSVCEYHSQAWLAEQLGCFQSRVSQIVKSNPEALVHFDKKGNPERIEYQRTITIDRK